MLLAYNDTRDLAPLSGDCFKPPGSFASLYDGLKQISMVCKNSVFAYNDVKMVSNYTSVLR